MARITVHNLRPPAAPNPMPRPSHLSPDNILRFLQITSQPASASEISQGLYLKKADNRPLFKMLAKLKKRHAI
jgi:hypothetical protein